ncbi:MAG: MBL fold metallo-hydrolase [Symbiobacteriia bacterium]
MAATQYEHFTTQALADGVYAAIVTPTGAAAANSGIVVLGDRTVVFDTTATVTAGRELRRIAADLTGLPVSQVIISHPHPDHVHGNVAFAGDATLIAAEGTGRAMAETGLQLMAGFRQQIAGAIQGVEATLAAVTAGAQGEASPEQPAAHAEQRAALLADLQSGRAFMEGFPSPADYRLPHLTFTDELALHGGGRIARVIACGEAHSEGDAVLYLPEERVLFAGDLVTEGNLVFRYGNPERWLQVLDRLDGLEPEVLIPGHGQVLPARAAIDRARQYITGFLREMKEAVANGATEAYAAAVTVPEGLDEFWYRDNVKALIRRLTPAS